MYNMIQNIKESFECESKYEAFYTGGDIFWSNDGENIFCHNQSHISIISVSKGAIKANLGRAEENQEEDIVNCFAVSTDNSFIVTHHKSSLFKLWNLQSGRVEKVWKSIHNGPVAKIAFSNRGLIMASGGVDSSVRIWDIHHHTCTHNFKQTQGVVSVLEFHPNAESNLLFASADDHIIHGFNLDNAENKIKLEGHFSKVTSLSFHEDNTHAVSSGRDRVIILWDIKEKKSVRVLPVYECIEGAFIIPSDSEIPIEKKQDSIYIASAGEKGIVKIWEMITGHMVFEQTNSLIPAAKDENGIAIKHLLFNKQNNAIGLVSTSHNIILYTLSQFKCTKQLVGYIDEIFDIVHVGTNESHIAVATNTADIKLYELSSMNCQILCGHTNIVLSLATSPANSNVLVSSDKDCSVRLWLMDNETKFMNCIGVGTRHTSGVGSVALSQKALTFFASVSQDHCLKMWELPAKFEYTGSIGILNSTNTVVGHQQDINCVTVSPNDKLIATGSQDKTAKLWSSGDLSLLGVFRGHRRGIWCVRFSSIDQVIATSSADCTIKLWSISELNCLKTFEGHDCAVLRVEFISRGMQLISSGTDGLIKLWNLKTSECVTTLDKHENKVWTLATNNNESHLISGDINSLLVVWRDTTKERKEKELAEKEELMKDEQKLANCLKEQKLTKALKLALRLGKPLHALKIVEELIKQGDDKLSSTVCDLKLSQQEELLKFAVTWNTNSRSCQAGQLIINIIVNEISIENLESTELKKNLEGLIPYTDRHFKRLTKLYQDLHILSYSVNCMKSHASIVESNDA